MSRQTIREYFRVINSRYQKAVEYPCSFRLRSLDGTVGAVDRETYGRGNRLSHLLYLGWQEVFSNLFAVRRLPLASTTLTRLLERIRKMKEVEAMSEGLREYLKRLIPWKDLKKDRLTFDSTVLERYGKREGVKRRYTPKKKGRGSHSPLLAFLNKSKECGTSMELSRQCGVIIEQHHMVFESIWQGINGFIDIKGIIADSVSGNLSNCWSRAHAISCLHRGSRRESMGKVENVLY